MVAHKASFDAGEVKLPVILVIVILGAEEYIPVAGHILLEESYKVFEEFEAGDNELDFIFRCKNSEKYSPEPRRSRSLRRCCRGGRWLRGCPGRRGRSGGRRRGRSGRGGGKCGRRRGPGRGAGW